jgi:uncharacterized caspase-like protein
VRKPLHIFILVLFAWALAFPKLSSPALAADRLALVIGNSGYKNVPLANPANDATLMATTLETASFNVTKIIDADQKSMKRALMNFSRDLRKSGADGVFYYAGHAVQVNNKNYLIPIGADIEDESELDLEAIDVNAFLGTMARSSKASNIVILDACRNNPFANTFVTPLDGLAKVLAPRGTFIAYATAPGQVAYDGTSGNSPYTLALTQAMTRPGLTIEQVFKQARREVLAFTKELQIPWENSSITRDFYFMEHNQLAAGENPGETDVSTIELTYWNSIRNSKNLTLFRSYLQKFPNGSFSPIAAEKIKTLTAE